ncbi:family 20 glycosylhydrolase [Streptomyces sp. ISL-36]|uniref:family 20 glycosylhydrolase n=1 Tax=Streptomyces sp. ISL-36 TaxID=2819182 RepID=UPI001BE6F2FE|nr:family 20 glycosylhydrolase [Streptomyces sp. ISL-36]MBT2440163.1 family 20 glycosylhydrolase [Streptomyces sp. ISL-36]
MNTVIPAPAVRAARGSEGALPAAGPWQLRADPELETVTETVRALLEPHLGERLLPHGASGASDLTVVPGASDLSGTSGTAGTAGVAGAPGSVLHLTLDAPPPPSVLHLTLDAPPPPPRAVTGVAPDGGTAPADESYGLSVGPGGITCRARTAVGVFRAATTALQLLAAAGPSGLLDFQDVSDAPHYAWRGLMIDPARCFITPDEVRRVIDLAALYKLNVLHLHLTDNEGWRIEVPSLPALTAGRLDGGDGGFYSADEYRALQAYAARRHVTLVPEIDLPGHCAALRAALPGLPPAPAPEGLAGRFPYVPPLDLADPDTHAVVSDVLADVCALTTGPFVHIGGDEAVGITDDGFATAVRRLRTLVRSFGKRPLAWQESARAGVTPDDIAQFWVDVPMMDLPDTAEELAARPELRAAGYTVELVQALRRFFAPSDHDVERVLAGGGKLLLSPQSHLYLDRGYAFDVTPPAAAADAARLGFPGYRPRDVRYTASWNPASHGIPDDRIAGVEATLFGETLRGLDDLTTMLLPRLGSIAETAWSGRPPEWTEHRARAARHARLWRDRGLAHFPATDIPWH